MPESADSLTSKQTRFLACLLTAPTVEAAVVQAGCARRTAYSWLQEPKFRDAYREARREALRQATARLQQAAGEAVDTLREVMKDERAMPAARVSAARTILESALKASELEDLEVRLTELEERLGPAGRQTSGRGSGDTRQNGKHR